MNLATLIVILAIAALAFLAVRRIKRKKLLFSCGGNCSSCAMNCSQRKAE